MHVHYGCSVNVSVFSVGMHTYIHTYMHTYMHMQYGSGIPLLGWNAIHRLYQYLNQGDNTLIVIGGPQSVLFINANVVNEQVCIRKSEKYFDKNIHTWLNFESVLFINANMVYKQSVWRYVHTVFSSHPYSISGE